MEPTRTVNVARPKASGRSAVDDLLEASKGVVEAPPATPAPALLPRETVLELRNVYDPTSGSYRTVVLPVRVPDAQGFGAIRKMMAAGRGGYPPSSFSDAENEIINAQAVLLGWCVDAHDHRDDLALILEDATALLMAMGGLLSYQERYFRRPVGSDGGDPVAPVVLVAGADPRAARADGGAPAG